MAKDEELKYTIKFDKKTAAITEVKGELDGLQSETEAKSNKVTEALGGMFTTLREGFLSVRRVISTVLGVFGLVVIAIELVKTAIDNQKKGQDDLIESTLKNFQAHTDLVRKYNEAEKAGVDLTEAQKQYRDVLKEVADIERDKVITALTAKRAELAKTNETIKENVSQLEKGVAAAENDKVAIGGVGRQLALEKIALKESNLALAENAAAIDAARGKSKDAADELNEQTKDVKLRGEIKKQELDKELADLDNAQAIALANTDLNEQQKIDIIRNTLEEKGALVDFYSANEGLAAQDKQIKLIEIAKKGAKDTTDIAVAEAKKKISLQKAVGDLTETIVKKSADTVVSTAYEAGLKGNFNAKKFAADIVRIAGQAAAEQILIYGLVGAFNYAAKSGDIVGASAWVAASVAAAAAVSALTGAAVRAITPPETPPPAPAPAPTPPGPTRETIAGGAGEVLGAPPTAIAGRNIIINISGSDALQSEKVAREIAEQIERLERA